jgi:hypothetical protein
MSQLREQCRRYLEQWARERLGAATEVSQGKTHEAGPDATGHFVVRYSWSVKNVILSTAFRVPFPLAEQALSERRTDLFDALYEQSRRGVMPR